MRIAVVGSGSIGRRHLKNLLSLGYRDLVCVSEFKRLESLTIAGINVEVVHDYQAVLSPDFDCIVVCNPSSMHFDYLGRGVRAGKHILLEKPASTNAEGIREIIAEAALNNIVIAMVHQFRHHPHLEKIKNKVHNGKIGRILRVEAMQGEHIADYHPGEDYRLSYAARAELGGGVLLTQIHLIDYLNWIFGPITAAFGLGGGKSNLDLDVEDNVSFLLHTEEKTPIYGHMNYLQRPKELALNVVGEKGIINWNYYEGSFSLVNERGSFDERETISLKRNQMFISVLKDFFQAVRSECRPRSSLEDGLAALKVVEAVKHSIANRTISFI